MAIFGDLEHLSFIDLTRVLAHQTGTLFLRTAYGGHSVELHLDQAELRGLYLDGFPVNDPIRLHSTLHGLMTSATGTFEFQPAPLTALTPHLKLPFSELLEAHGAPLVPEVQLPHADTRFGLIDQPPEPPASLLTSWQRVQPCLARGASAVDLARQLPLSELQGRELLHRLRTAGLIVPVRAALPAAPAHSPLNLDVQPVVVPSESSAAPEAGPVRRLLNALRRFTSVAGRA